MLREKPRPIPFALSAYCLEDLKLNLRAKIVTSVENKSLLVKNSHLTRKVIKPPQSALAQSRLSHVQVFKSFPESAAARICFPHVQACRRTENSPPIMIRLWFDRGVSSIRS